MESYQPPTTIPGMIAIDLQNFNDFRLTSGGELEVSPEFNHEILMHLGSDILALSKIEVPVGPIAEKALFTAPAQNAFVLRNISKVGAKPAVLFDDQISPMSATPINYQGFTLFKRTSLVIGRDLNATPELELSDTVKPEHALIRLGNMQGKIHFSAANDGSEATVYLHQDDERYVRMQSRYFRYAKAAGQIITQEAMNGRWTR